MLIVAFVVMRKSKKKVKEPPQVVSVTSLIAAFVKDAPQANRQYLDKLLEVEGIVKAIEPDNGIVWLSGERSVMISVKCNVKGGIGSLEAGDTVRMQGTCKGYMIHITLSNAKIVL
ncbi:MAG TPA: hypothetical protein VIM75_16965 [Ohtaekwangia sp.]